MTSIIRRTHFAYLYVIFILLLASCVRPPKPAPTPPSPPPPPPPFTLSIMHTNDTHAHILPFNRFGNTCSEQEAGQGQCFGGVARRATEVKRIRETEPNAILVDAGDQFQGTLFYTEYKGKPMQQFMNELGYDAMTLGNHEFDDGPQVLADFASGLKFPIVSSNIVVADEPLLKDLIKPYVVKQIEGHSVGIVGYTTEDLASISNPGPSVVVEDIDSSMAKAVDELEKQNVSIIVALSHAGLARDLELASSMDGIDVIVGGHTHSYLSNTDPESEGTYPIMMNSPSGDPVLVVTAAAWGKYLGHLDVTFDDKGVADEWKGDPILLDNSISQDEAVLAEAMEWDSQLATFRTQLIGQTTVDLGGQNQMCRYEECNLGNLITDAMLWETRAQGTQIAFFNGGGIRASIPAGDITMENILEVLPFLDTVATLELTGADLRQVLEHGVSKAESNQNEGTGRFLQVAGLKFTWDPTKPVGSRVIDVRVKNAEGNYVRMSDATVYKVATSGFLRGGGDGHVIFKEKGMNTYDFGRVLSDVLVGYIEKMSPLSMVVEGRIVKRQ